MTLLFLPFGAIASAENETHPVNGEWTLQSESFGGSEQHYRLTFYPDGNFRLIITETSSVVSEEYENELLDYMIKQLAIRTQWADHTVYNIEQEKINWKGVKDYIG